MQGRPGVISSKSGHNQVLLCKSEVGSLDGEAVGQEQAGSSLDPPLRSHKNSPKE